LRDTTHVSLPFDLHLPDTLVICEEAIEIKSNVTGNMPCLWNTGETTRNIHVVSEGWYWLEILDNGCPVRDSVLVVSRSIPPFEIQSSDLCQDNNTQLSVDVNDDNLGYLWSTGETSSAIFMLGEGVYTVEVFNEHCSASASITIVCPCELWLPNVFTPNGDNINEEYLPVFSSQINKFSMHIYDRWGSLIYRTESLIPWDGTHKGREATAGVYYCVIEYSCMNEPEKKIRKQSSVTLLR